MYHAVSGGAPLPQVGVFLRCAGLAGEAFFTLADRARLEIEPLLMAEIGPGPALEWGTSHHPGMTDIAAILASTLPWTRQCRGTADPLDASGRGDAVALFRTPNWRSRGEP